MYQDTYNTQVGSSQEAPTAILYTRVSTDEQADRGYSLRDQESRLRDYCTRNRIEVHEHFQDDASAKTFNRPGWRALMACLKARRGEVHRLLFVKWDRFSRNATDALQMIRALDELGVVPQAIEQPIDRNVPEQLIMLAIYVATPEVENRRRSLATKQGLRRAMKEGRWTTRVPTGYKRSRDANDKPILLLDDNAELVREAFALAAQTLLPIAEIRRRLAEKGLWLGMDVREN